MVRYKNPPMYLGQGTAQASIEQSASSEELSRQQSSHDCGFNANSQTPAYGVGPGSIENTNHHPPIDPALDRTLDTASGPWEATTAATTTTNHGFPQHHSSWGTPAQPSNWVYPDPTTLGLPLPSTIDKQLQGFVVPSGRAIGARSVGDDILDELYQRSQALDMSLGGSFEEDGMITSGSRQPTYNMNLNDTTGTYWPSGSSAALAMVLLDTNGDAREIGHFEILAAAEHLVRSNAKGTETWSIGQSSNSRQLRQTKITIRKSPVRKSPTRRNPDREAKGKTPAAAAAAAEEEERTDRAFGSVQDHGDNRRRGDSRGQNGNDNNRKPNGTNSGNGKQSGNGNGNAKGTKSKVTARGPRQQQSSPRPPPSSSPPPPPPPPPSPPRQELQRASRAMPPRARVSLRPEPRPSLKRAYAEMMEQLMSPKTGRPNKKARKA
ncbi:hypothetical protein PV10_04816 [Exophiala mesophila]|uniref:Uncharacterized protein n=1 Tax=Exophiala mesophila TaxID=212818 RepID=A0A0D1WW74_EXOME|nr:uncharacterized protein PV10_04816 [Exophiala mesophila]KIV93615.1 hypothetical protein PV10_04816 [Exophiala mesophila]